MKNPIKNQISKSRINITIILFAIFSIFCTSCKKDSVTASCDTTNTNFHQLYNSVAAISGNIDEVNYDYEEHEYSFTVASNETVCQIGYQGQSAMPTGPLTYEIQLRDSTTNTALYLINTTFDTLQTSYVSVPNISLVPGHIYTVKRTLVHHYYHYPYTVSRLVRINSIGVNPMSFPYTVGNMTIIGSKLFDYTTTSYNQNISIPFIDIVFQ
ncbi:MAG: hypothetical protein U0U67_08835 [Chitinophagales bacterium]